MTLSTSERTRREIYNHSRSKERRAPPKPDPVAVLRERHYDEKATLGTRHRRESVDLEQKFQEEKARDRYPDNDPPDMEKRRRDLQKKHQTERAETEKRHRTEINAAAAKNPLP